MECPKCGEDMDFEEIKNWCGIWYCTDQDKCCFEADGTKFPVDWNEYDETFDKPNGGYLPYDKDTAGCDKYHRMKDDGLLNMLMMKWKEVKKEREANENNKDTE